MTLDARQFKDTEELEVYRDHERVGRLARTKAGASFTYEPSALEAQRAIAFRMPVQAEPYQVRGTNLHPFFAGLLPEGLRLGALVKGLKTSEDDLFTLLAAAGNDTVGDVWARVPGAELGAPSPMVEPRALGKHSFGELLDQSLSLGVPSDTITVAGVQPKISAGMISFPVRSHSRQRAHILKLTPPNYPQLVENEAFFMKLAKGIGLRTATVKLVHDREGASGLLVERFDRVQQESREGPLLKLHQEDACQLLDRYPSEKYRVSLAEVAEALEDCSAPSVERLRLLQLQAFSYLIVNGDLHAKNISVRTLDGRTQLTPAYDLLCTLPYGDAKLALKLEGRDEKLSREDFIAFGERIGVPPGATRRMLGKLVAGIGKGVPRLHEIGLDEKRTAHMEAVITERLARIGARE